MCVELDLTKPLIPSFSVEGQTLSIVYESLSMLCTKCGWYGHSKEGCIQFHRMHNEQGMDVETQGEGNKESEVNGEVQDLWRTVQRGGKGSWERVHHKQYKQGKQNASKVESAEVALGRKAQVERAGQMDKGRQGIRREKVLVVRNSEGLICRAAEDMHTTENCEFIPDSILGSNKWKTLNMNGKENLHPGGVFVKTEMGKQTRGWGAASKGFAAVLKDTKFRYKVDVAVILEPRISGALATKTIKSWGFKFSERVEAVGFSGGIWILWNLEDICMDVLVKEEQFIHCRLTLNGKGMLFTAVYANPNEHRRQRLWNSLHDLAGEIAEPWLLAGDFNEIKSPLEQKGGGRVNEVRCRKFSEWIQTCGLLDMEANGPFFTWKGPKWEGLDRVYKRLDRCLCNVNWLEVFENAEVRVVPRVGSDHHPLLVNSCADLNFAGRRNFKYEMMWQMHENFTSSCEVVGRQM
ncbi:hypothetical protein K1719_024436 [Acacia pycnantha]|nr:hypothetical protein K1719_024436 [Acacia pycnantha]